MLRGFSEMMEAGDMVERAPLGETVYSWDSLVWRDGARWCRTPVPGRVLAIVQLGFHPWDVSGCYGTLTTIPFSRNCNCFHLTNGETEAQRCKACHRGRREGFSA